MESIYKIADREIRSCIADYLELSDISNGLTTLKEEHLNTDRKKVIILAGLNVRKFDVSSAEVILEWERRSAVPFELETAITTGVYKNIRKVGSDYLNEIERESSGFTSFAPTFIHENPYFLPIFQHLSGVFSKSALKKHVGSVSDNSISVKAAVRVAALLKERVHPPSVNKGEILQRLESTLEGIVRDLVGRVLLESIVDSALKKKGIKFKREEEYASLSGIVYNFRADFIVPDEENPLAFIEVRKSSARHASLYAKDKMFSAINWKGKHKEILAILVVDGEWTAHTLKVMADVFDYVVPITKIVQLTDTIAAYVAGDKTKLKWLIQFRIDAAPTTYS